MLDPHNVKVFLQRFFAKYGMFFIGAYLVTFFILITFMGGREVDTFFGDIRFELAGNVIYLPFTSALAGAIFVTLIFQVYLFLK